MAKHYIDSSIVPNRVAARVSAPQSWKDPKTHWQIVLTHPWYRHLARIQPELHMAIHDYFTSRNMITVSMPVTTASVSSPMGLGSDSLPVEVELFGIKTYLADSMQFMLEFGCRLHNAGVYYVMPCFRGERTDQYHLAQFYHAEAEIPGQLGDVITLASGLVHRLSEIMLARCADSVLALAGTVAHIEQLLALQGRYVQCSFDEAVSLLTDDPTFIRHHSLGFDTLTRAGEAELIRQLGHGGPVWLTHFDQLAVPFYQAVDESSQKALNADLLLGTCETIGSGQRHATSTEVRNALKKHQVAESPYAWYLTMRDDTPMQTSGFGMGIERYLLWLLQHDDIRDLTILYRDNHVAVLP
jgi:asparaginyl-tRNA synthetase